MCSIGFKGLLGFGVEVWVRVWGVGFKRFGYTGLYAGVSGLGSTGVSGSRGEPEGRKVPSCDQAAGADARLPRDARDAGADASDGGRKRDCGVNLHL